jgi:hypothetical protein
MPRSAVVSGTLARMRSLRRALLWASAAGLWFSCSVNHAGLSDDAGVHADVGPGAAGSGATAGRGGGGGDLGTTGTAGGAGTVVTGTGGASTGTAGAAATAGAGGTSGSAGAGGDSGAAGNGAGGSPAGAAGTSGGAGDAGTAGAGNAGGSAGAAGVAGAAGTIGGAGGAGGTGGTAGTIGGRGGFGFGGFGGSGARGGQGGRGGAAGRGGTGGNPCATYPSGAKAFVTPTDGRTHCYWARSSSQTWSEAQQSCTLQNGHLATILSAEENAFVVSIAQFSSNFADTWIGATDGKAGGDKSGAGTYRWVTNETWSYSNWEQDQPDGYCDPCSGPMTCTCDHRAVLSSDGTWNDRWQDNMRSSVCEATAN